MASSTVANCHIFHSFANKVLKAPFFWTRHSPRYTQRPSLWGQTINHFVTGWNFRNTILSFQRYTLSARDQIMNVCNVGKSNSCTPCHLYKVKDYINTNLKQFFEENIVKVYAGSFFWSLIVSTRNRPCTSSNPACRFSAGQLKPKAKMDAPTLTPRFRLIHFHYKTRLEPTLSLLPHNSQRRSHRRYVQDAINSPYSYSNAGFQTYESDSLNIVCQRPYFFSFQSRTELWAAKILPYPQSRHVHVYGLT